MANRMKYLKTSTVLAVLSAVILSASCSVKEDRTPCPSYLTVYYHEAVPVMEENGIHTGVITTVTNSAAFRFRSDVDPAEYPAGLEVPVLPKSIATVSAIAGVMTSEVGEDVLTYRRGAEPDRIWAVSDPVDCTGELAEYVVVLHKQYAVMRVIFKGADEYANLRMEVHGNFNAFETSTLIPVKGAFYTDLRHVHGETWEVIVPRQGDDALSLRLYDGDEYLYDVPVGKNLATAGYNWSKRDLDDFEVFLDWAVPEVGIKIAPWRDGGEESHII